VSTEPVTPAPETRSYFRPWLTRCLVGANVLVYLAMVLKGRTLTFGDQQLLNWGADYGPYTLGGQPWRLWTSTYVHGFIWHIAGNMWCLWNLGALTERILGRWRFLAIYTACGIAGSIASLMWHPAGLSVGASGAILGLAGVLISVIYLVKLPFPQEALQAIKRSLVQFTALTLMLGFIPIVDNSAHVGGLLAGLIIGAMLAFVLHSPRAQHAGLERIVFLGVALALFGAWVAVKHSRSYVVPLGRASQALRRGDAAKALPDFEAVARQRPNDATIQRMLGFTYIQLKDYPHAEASLKRVLDLKPHDLNAHFNLGLVYGATARYEEARQQFAIVTEREPKNDDAWMMLGSSLKELHKAGDAEIAFQHAIQFNPRNYQAMRELGWVQLEQNQPDAALQSFQSALQINDKDPDSVLGLGRAYLAKKMSNEAAAALRRYQALRPSSSENSDGNNPSRLP
jgi:rhomboid protease GluP